MGTHQYPAVMEPQGIYTQISMVIPPEQSVGKVTTLIVIRTETHQAHWEVVQLIPTLTRTEIPQVR